MWDSVLVTLLCPWTPSLKLFSHVHVVRSTHMSVLGLLSVLAQLWECIRVNAPAHPPASGHCVPNAEQGLPLNVAVFLCQPAIPASF